MPTDLNAWFASSDSNDWFDDPFHELKSDALLHECRVVRGFALCSSESELPKEVGRCVSRNCVYPATFPRRDDANEFSNETPGRCRDAARWKDAKCLSSTSASAVQTATNPPTIRPFSFTATSPSSSPSTLNACRTPRGRPRGCHRICQRSSSNSAESVVVARVSMVAIFISLVERQKSAAVRSTVSWIALL